MSTMIRQVNQIGQQIRLSTSREEEVLSVPSLTSAILRAAESKASDGSGDYRYRFFFAAYDTCDIRLLGGPACVGLRKDHRALASGGEYNADAGDGRGPQKGFIHDR
jgi:hypothetical protein